MPNGMPNQICSGQPLGQGVKLEILKIDKIGQRKHMSTLAFESDIYCGPPTEQMRQQTGRTNVGAVRGREEIMAWTRESKTNLVLYMETLNVVIHTTCPDLSYQVL